MSTVTLYAIRETYNQDAEAYDQFAKALKKGGGELLQGSVTKAADKAGIGSARPVFYSTADEAKLDDPKTKVRFEVISQRAFDKKFGRSPGQVGQGYTSVDISDFERTTSKTQKAGEQRFSAATQRAEKN